MGEISQRMLKGNAQGAVEGARAQIAEVEQLVQQLEDVVGSELVPSSMDVLKEPSGRDLYLAHIH
ncbi:hypothetical protein LPJ69_007249 [Coemansia sp. RSA 1752]|nr:hypothetical protein LPJ69_007249 [Coemansia sp. RSA 1752]